MPVAERIERERGIDDDIVVLTSPGKGLCRGFVDEMQVVKMESYPTYLGYLTPRPVTFPPVSALSGGDVRDRKRKREPNCRSWLRPFGPGSNLLVWLVALAPPR